MNLVDQNKIQNALIVFIDVVSLKKDNKLENSFDEYKSLVHSSGIFISEEIKIKQRSPTISTFISKGKLEALKDITIRNDIALKKIANGYGWC